MSTNIIHKRTAVAGRSPTTSQLQFGEIAVNTVDGAIYFKINDGSDRIIEATKDRFVLDVVNNGSTSYDFTGVGLSSSANATMYLQRGVTYEFHVNASGHPFYIKTVSGTGTGNQYTDGVTNNGADVGIVIFTVPMDAPSILYYNCSVHSSMAGTIYVLSEDADTLDGQHGSYYLDYTNFTNTPSIPSDISDLTDTTNLIPSDVSDLTDTTGVIPTSIDDLTDVDITSAAPTTGQVLKWNGSAFVPADDVDTTLTLSSQSIDDLGDVDTTTTSPSVGQVLKWDGSNWAPANDSTASGTGIALTDLSATNASASGGGSLAYDNTTGVFTFTPPDLSSYLTGITSESIGDLSDVDITTSAPTNGQTLVWDAANSKFIPGASAGYSDSDVDTHLNTSSATSGQVLSWNGSDYAWVAQASGGGGGGGGGLEAGVFTYTAGSNITSVSGADDNGNTLTFESDRVEVYVNGIRLVGNGVDYTASSGTTITFTQTVFNGSVVEVVALEQINAAEVSLTTTSATAVFTASATKYRTVKLILQMTHATNGYHSTEVLVIHDGTTAYMTEYATIFSSASLGVVDATINSGNIEVTVAATTANTDVRAKVLSIEV